MVWSALQLAKSFPSGEKANSCTVASWSATRCVRRKVVKSKNVSAPSSPPATSMVPSGESASAPNSEPS